MKTYNLATKSGIKVLDTFDNRNQFDNSCKLADYLKTGISAGRYNQLIYVYQPTGINDGYCYFLKNGIDIGASYGINHLVRHASNDRPVTDYLEIGIPTFACIPSSNKNQKYVLVLNGDEDVALPIIPSDVKTEVLTISFTCLSRFYEQKENVYENEHIRSVISKLTSGKIKVIDYSPDSEIKISAVELKQIKKLEKKNPVSIQLIRESIEVPKDKVGYTLVGTISNYKTIYKWHRSASAILYDTVGKFSILLGQDEGSYFGCQLADNPKNLAAAFLSLQPKEILGTNSKRQGEWFFLKIEESDVPKDEECIAIVKSNNDELYLNKETDGANHHVTSVKPVKITKDGVYAFSPTLMHGNGDHIDVSEVGWVKFCKNTAVRSFSVQGVD